MRSGVGRAALVVALCVLGACRPAGACEIRAQVPTLESFARLGADGEPAGYAVAVTREALSRIGCRARFIDLPAPRSWPALAAGELDLLFGVRPLAERQASAWFAGPIDHIRLGLYVRRSALPPKAMQRLADVRGTTLRIGIERLSSYGEEYDRLLDDPAFLDRLRIVLSRESAQSMLASGRLDAVFADAASVPLIPGVVLVQAVALPAVPVHIGLSRASVDRERFDAFRAALDAMAEDGTLERLRRTEGLEGEAPAPDNETPP